MEAWSPRDGDTFTTKEDFVFYVFGYEHPANCVFSFLKYIPSGFQSLFQIRYLRRRWNLGDVTLVRAEKLYTARNYKRLIETLREHFPDYVYFCPFRMKEVISVPLASIRKIFEPKRCLERLMKNRDKDCLEMLALELISFLSEQSGVQLEDFGIHGSIALNMHTSESDIDFVVYGFKNFRKVEETIGRLVIEGELEQVFKNRIDIVRRHKGRYKGKLFVYNAVRKMEETHFKYGERSYKPIKDVVFQCSVINDEEAMFRPAIYKIADYQPSNSSSELPREEVPTEVISMIGCYRNIARRGDRIEVSGTLEKVEHVESGQTHYQVVVGTGIKEKEYIQPLQNRKTSFLIQRLLSP